MQKKHDLLTFVHRQENRRIIDSANILLVISPPWGVNNPPMPLGYLARYLRDKGIGYKIFDLNLELFNRSRSDRKELWNVENDYIWRNTPSGEMISQLDGFEKLMSRIIDSDSTVVGFSLVDPNQFISCHVIKRIKKECPRKFIVVGGPVCATLEERVWLRDNTDGLIDFIVIGEGEKPLVELLRKLGASLTNKEIVLPGVVDCRHSGDMTPSSMGSPLDLCEISFPDYKGFPLDLYDGKSAAVMWSRGCISNCAFCKEKSLWDKHRTRPIEDIIAEIRFYKERDICEFVVYDSLVNGRPEHLEMLCDTIISQGLNIWWSALAIPDKSLTKELLEKMKLAGCFVLIFGLESGSAKILKKMRKRFLLTDAVTTIKNTKQVGIKTGINIIVGFPGEGETEFNKTIDFIDKYHHYIDRLDAVTPLQLVRGTYLFNHHEKFGIELPSERANEYWSTLNKTNTYEIRMKRRQKVSETCNRHGIKIRKDFHSKKPKTSGESSSPFKSHHEIDILFVEFTHNEIPDYDTASILEHLDQNHISSAHLRMEGKSKPGSDSPSKLKGCNARFLAVKSAFAQHINFIEILRNIRDKNRNSIIILWGPECRTEGQRQSFPAQLIDAIVFQQYEKAFKELVLNFDNNRSNRSMPGVYVYGQPYIPLSPPRDLSRFSFPLYAGFHKELNSRNSLPIRLSRGCPYRCFFCSIYLEQGPYRLRKPQSVYEEMRYHYESNGVTEFIFQDCAVNGNPETVEAFCNILAVKKIPISWKAKYIIPEGEKDFPFGEMAAAGCTELNFGYISGSDSVLKLMGKPFDSRTVKNALMKARKNGLRTTMGLLVGYPGESENNFLDTVRFVFDNKEGIDNINQISPFHIQPGSLIEKEHEQYDIFMPRRNHWRDWHDGSYNNFSYRLKRSKELVIVLEGLGLLSAFPEYLKEDDEILKNRDQIFERYTLYAANSSKDSHPDKLSSENSLYVNEPIAKGIFSNAQTFAGPETLEIDLTNNCNLNCIGCWCHSPLLGKDKFLGDKKKKYLPKKTILALLDEVRSLGGNVTVQLAGAGEPFLHPDIWEIIGTIKEYGMTCNIITNFTLIEKKDIRRLVDYGVDFITASIWAGDQITYSRTHPGTPVRMFERLKKNLSFLTETRGTIRLPKLKIYHVVNKFNANNINLMVDFALQVGADSVELTMVDVVPGKTGSLRPDPEAQERILAQFKSIRGRPDYTSEFICTEHLKPFEDKMFYEELKEFGRIYPILKEGFSYDSDRRKIRCPTGKRSVRKEIFLEDASSIFSFERRQCTECARIDKCWPKGVEVGRLRVQPMIILGAGSFIRRLTSSKREIQEYEHKIIDRIPCTVGWTYARITVDGHVIPCCKASKFPLGNLHEDSFSKIWKSPVYSEFRENAKALSKKDPYFKKINCYRSCDNLGMNLQTYLRLMNFIKK